MQHHGFIPSPFPASTRPLQVLSGAYRVNDEMLLTAARRLSECVTLEEAREGKLFPRVQHTHAPQPTPGRHDGRRASVSDSFGDKNSA